MKFQFITVVFLVTCIFSMLCADEKIKINDLNKQLVQIKKYNEKIRLCEAYNKEVFSNSCCQIRSLEKNAQFINDISKEIKKIRTEEVKLLTDLIRQYQKIYKFGFDYYLENQNQEKVQKLFKDYQKICLLISEAHKNLKKKFNRDSFCCEQSKIGQLITANRKISEKPIYIVGIVFSDGLGDYYNMLAVAECIHLKYPEQEIRAVVDFYGVYQNFSDFLYKPPWLELTVFDEISLHEKLKVAEKFFEAALIIDAGNDAYDKILHIKHFCNLDVVLDRVSEKWIKIAEPSGEFREQADFLGFGEKQSGLILLPCSKNGKNGFTKKIKEHFLLQENTAFAYVRNNSVFPIFFLFCNLSYYKNNTNLTLFMKWEKAKKSLNTEFSKKLLKKLGVQKVEFYSEGLYPWEKKHKEIFVQAKGKVVRIVNCFPVSYSEFSLLSNSVSSPLSGCTGDRSFAEIISKNIKIPIYEDLEHKRELWNDYVLLAQKKLGTINPYVKFLSYYTRVLDKIFLNKELLVADEIFLIYSLAIELVRLVENPNCIDGMKELHEYLFNEKNASKEVISMIEKNIILLKGQKENI